MLRLWVEDSAATVISPSAALAGERATVKIALLRRGTMFGERYPPAVGGRATTAAGPPAAGTRRMAPPAVNAIEPSDDHVAVRPSGAAEIVCACPPVTVTFRSSPAAKNATHRLSGEKNGSAAPAVS